MLSETRCSSLLGEAKYGNVLVPGLVATVVPPWRNSRSRLTIQVRNGYTGRKVAAVTFRESNLHMRTEVEDKLWTKIGPSLARACADASKPRKRDRDPLMIEAGTPLADK